MNERVAIAPVRKTVHVKVPIAHAFEVFTSGLTRWWPHNHGIGKKPIQKVLMEPRLGGRWIEIAEDGTETSAATIILWEPPHRFVMLWQVNAQWKPDLAMKSEVDVRFTADGPEATQRRARAPQVRDHGCGSGRVDAQGRRRRLAGPDAALCRGSRAQQQSEVQQ